MLDDDVECDRITGGIIRCSNLSALQASISRTDLSRCLLQLLRAPLSNLTMLDLDFPVSHPYLQPLQLIFQVTTCLRAVRVLTKGSFTDAGGHIPPAHIPSLRVVDLPLLKMSFSYFDRPGIAILLDSYTLAGIVDTQLTLTTLIHSKTAKHLARSLERLVVWPDDRIKDRHLQYVLDKYVRLRELDLTNMEPVDLFAILSQISPRLEALSLKCKLRDIVQLDQSLPAVQVHLRDLTIMLDRAPEDEHEMCQLDQFFDTFTQRFGTSLQVIPPITFHVA